MVAASALFGRFVPSQGHNHANAAKKKKAPRWNHQPYLVPFWWSLAPPHPSVDMDQACAVRGENTMKVFLFFLSYVFV